MIRRLEESKARAQNPPGEGLVVQVREKVVGTRKVTRS